VIPSARTDEAVIDVRDVRVAFGPKPVLRGISLRIRRGETVAILGESGGGKTVLLKVMLGLLTPDAGEAYLLGVDVHGLSDDGLIPLRKRCAVVYQGGALFSGLDVGENVALELREVLHLPAREIEERVRWALEAVGLADTNPRLQPEELSGGMKKRLAVARAIAPRPEVIFYDEPTSGLDPLNSARILKLIDELRQRLGVTSVVVTHDVHGACAIADRIVFLSGGVVAYDGPPAGFRTSDDPRVVAYRSSVAGPAAPVVAR
jgi:phospholipid/cholesterol/gamma-HCH transport system ATP-binding protein